MALHPYDGMTLDLPTEDGVWVEVTTQSIFANCSDATWHITYSGSYYHTYVYVMWKPDLSEINSFQYASNGSNFVNKTITYPYIGIGARSYIFGNSAGFRVDRYQGFYQVTEKNHSTSIGPFPDAIIDYYIGNITGNPISPSLFGVLFCKKEGENYLFKLEYSSAVAKLSYKFFFWDDGIPEPKLTYRVYANWTYQEDPNTGGGESSTGGGDGGHDDHSDTINIPGLPSISAAQAGLITLFKPELSELRSLNNYLWTNWNDFIENLQKFFSNPIDYIIALNILPVTPNTGSSRKVKLGLWETSVSMAPVSSQWYEFDCGTLTLPKYWGSALDYAPYTKVGCMLPFIGYVDLNTDEIMGKVLQIKYHIDLLSGSCVALITVNGSLYYQFTGECAVPIPITGDNWSRIYSAAIGAIGTAVSGGIAAGASGAIAQAGFQSSNMLAAKNGLQAAKGFEAARDALKKGTHGRPALLQASKDARNTAIAAASGGGNVGRAITASRAISTLNNSVGQVMGGKMGVAHSGSIGGTAGLLGVRRPFLIIEYPNQSLADNYKHYMGYPSNITATCENLSGYTEFEQILLEGIPGTDEELAELNEALKGGVYF